MDRLDRIEKILEKVAKSQAEADRQRAADRAEADRQRAADEAKAEAEAKRRKEEWDRQRAEDQAKAEAEAKRRQEEWDRQRAEDQQRQIDWEKRDAELSKKIANVSEQVGGHANMIGEITEAMTVSDNIIHLVNKFKGIDVSYFSFNITRKYPAKNSKGQNILKQHEVDGIADGEKSVVVIEAKATLTRGYVKDFIKKLAIFKLAHPDYRHRDLYGAVTFVRAKSTALALAEKHGLFILKASPPDVELVNDEGFKPTKIG